MKNRLMKDDDPRELTGRDRAYIEWCDGRVTRHCEVDRNGGVWLWGNVNVHPKDRGGN